MASRSREEHEVSDLWKGLFVGLGVAAAGVTDLVFDWIHRGDPITPYFLLGTAAMFSFFAVRHNR